LNFYRQKKFPLPVQILTGTPSKIQDFASNLENA